MEKKILDLLKKYKLKELKDEILGAIQPSIQLQLVKSNDIRLKVGTSKIGGHPDLPVGWSIPKHNEKELHFIAQINLHDMQSHNVDGLLPKTGMLYFFYDANEQPWGFDPNDKGMHQVLFCEFPDYLRRVVPNQESFPPSVISFQTKPTVHESVYSDVEVEGDEPYEFAWEMSELHFDEGNGKFHHLLGHPQSIQSEVMDVECHLVTNGFYLGEGYPTDEEIEALEGSGEDWTLLFQLDSNDESAMDWGDDGRLYFWIKKGDLAQKNFENTWVILQCY